MRLSRFFVLEGLDGSGTTTQTQGLVAALKASGRAAVATGEPTGLETGRFLRQVLAGSVALRPETVAFLFAADRQEHLARPEDGIQACLDRGMTVVCDRYLFSSLAYQGVEGDPALVAALNSSFPLPEAVIFLDVPVEVCMERLAARKGKEIFEHAEFQHRVLARYREILAGYEDQGLPLLRLDGTQPPGELGRTILDFVLSRR